MTRELEAWEREYVRLVGRRVRVSRLAAGLTQEELAARAGLHRLTLSELERGEHGPGVLTYLRLSRSLGVWMGALLAEETPGAGSPATAEADRAEGLPS